MGEYVGAMRLDVFMRYALFRLVERQREESYKIYVTDHLKALLGKGSKSRWIDLIRPKQDIDADEIVKDIVDRAGLVIT